PGARRPGAAPAGGDRPRHRSQGFEVRPPGRARLRAARGRHRHGSPGGRGEARARLRGARRPVRVLQAQAANPRSDLTMRSRLCSLFTVTALALVATAAAEEKPSVTFNFDADKPGEPPKGFELARTGQGAEGKWVVRAAEG